MLLAYKNKNSRVHLSFILLLSCSELYFTLFIIYCTVILFVLVLDLLFFDSTQHIHIYLPLNVHTYSIVHNGSQTKPNFFLSQFFYGHHFCINYIRRETVTFVLVMCSELLAVHNLWRNISTSGVYIYTITSHVNVSILLK